jgi:hypothetical protein
MADDVLIPYDGDHRMNHILFGEFQRCFERRRCTRGSDGGIRGTVTYMMPEGCNGYVCE